MAITTATTDYRVGFDSQDREVHADDLPVTGTVPDWLTGTLVRTGPAKFEVGDRSLNHWFDGLAMLHRFGFADGRVSYANRFLQTRAYRAAADTGRLGYSEFATDPCRTVFQRVAAIFSPRFTDNAAVNVTRLGDEYVAMTETPLPVRFEAGTLRALGVCDWAGGIGGQTTTAHPHHDRLSGELVNYATHFGPTTSYRLYGLAPGARTPREIARVGARRPAYMHSFALTARYAVLVEFPFVVNPLALALSGRPFIENFRWRPERGTTFTVIDRSDGSTVTRAPGPPMFAFHHINAFEDGGEVVIDLCRYEDASIVEALYLEHLRDRGRRVPDAEPWRCRVPLQRGGEVRGERLADVSLELPRIAYGRHNAERYRYSYGTGTSTPGAFLDRLVKVDADSGESCVWQEPGCHPGEPVFVPAPEARGEDAGVILSVVLDTSTQSSLLLILDAATFEERARASAPLRIPFGFHGAFWRA